MKSIRRKTLVIEDLLEFLDDYNNGEPEFEILSQMLEALANGEIIEPGDEFYAPGHVLVIEGEPEDK